MIVNLREAPSALSQVAQWQFMQWGGLDALNTAHSRMAELQTHLGNDPLPCTLVAFQQDFLAGSVTLLAHNMPEYPALTPWLTNLYVIPQFRSKGLGAQLLREAERMAYSFGYDSLFLHTANALEYFLDRNWEPIQHFQRSSGQVMIMARYLTNLESENEPRDLAGDVS